MEIIQYQATDWFTHYLFVPAYWIPLLLRILMVAGAISLIYLVFKKILW
jgi:hypothetical protein